MLQARKDVEILTQSLNEKKILLKKFYKLTQQQTTAIEDVEMDLLDKIIIKKQTLIREIDKCDNQFTKQFETIKKKYNIADIGELNINKIFLKRLQEVISEVEGLLSKIKVIDDKNKQFINGSLSDTREKMNNLQKGKKARINYYKQPSQVGGVFLDKKN